MLKTKLKEERDEERRAKQTQEVEKPRANSGVSPLLDTNGHCSFMRRTTFLS